MKVLFRIPALVACVVALALPALAQEQESYDADARSAEDAPPVIPHFVADTVNGKACLACHGTGLKGAPVTPHPDRFNCTQCHVRSEMDAKTPGKKARTKQ
jgi:nitrate reductase cytochrome c-type subunit